jgi:predicted transcriptional regulator
MGGTDITITIDAYMADRLRVLGDARRRSLDSLVYQALERFLDEEEEKERWKMDEQAYHRGDLDS